MNDHRDLDQPGLELAPVQDLPEVVPQKLAAEKAYSAANMHQQQQYPYPQSEQSFYSQPHYQGHPPPPPSEPSMYTATTPYNGWRRDSYDGTYMSGPPPPPPPAMYTGKKIMGLRPKIFWLAVGPLLALLIVGLVVGLGVGLGTGHNSDSSSNNPATSPTTSSSTSTPTPTPTPVPVISCPAANGTTYNSDDTPFQVLCNVDYSGTGTTDSSNVKAKTANACFDICAADTSCAGAGWGNFNGDLTCFLKSSVGFSHPAENWFFAIKQ